MSGRECRQCGGTGSVISLNTIFVGDKTRKERCGICAGTGKSSYAGVAEYNRWQWRARQTFPRHPDYQPGITKEPQP